MNTFHPVGQIILLISPHHQLAFFVVTFPLNVLTFWAFTLQNTKIPCNGSKSLSLCIYLSMSLSIYLSIYLEREKGERERERNTGNKAEKIPLIINNHCIPRFETRIKNYVRQMINFRWTYFLNFSFIIILRNLTLNNCSFQIVIYLLIRNRCRSSCPEPPQVFCRKVVLRNFVKFKGKHLCQSFFFNKVAGLRPPVRNTSSGCFCHCVDYWTIFVFQRQNLYGCYLFII